LPTGPAIRDVREQLFGAAERVLLRDGPSGLTSRAVTTEAGCAKGVLHRHFDDFDAFLAEFVLDRAERMDPQAAALRGAAGTGTIVDNITQALTALFGAGHLLFADRTGPALDADAVRKVVTAVLDPVQRGGGPT
jgi:AcrR family transcriptional regulator